jgi:hypothetical protein
VSQPVLLGESAGSAASIATEDFLDPSSAGVQRPRESAAAGGPVNSDLPFRLNFLRNSFVLP